MRLCKLVTCRLTFFHLMDFQSVVIGFAGSQISLFGVNIIICHQFLTFTLLFTIAFYTHVVHLSKVGTGFPAKTQWVLVSVHSYKNTITKKETQILVDYYEGRPIDPKCLEKLHKPAQRLLEKKDMDVEDKLELLYGI